MVNQKTKRWLVSGIAVAMAVKRLETRAGAVANLRQWMTAVRTKCEK